VSKQDTHFFNMFSLVLGILITVAILLFAFARIVAGRTQEQQVLVEAQYLREVEGRIKPAARVAVAGQDNSALAIEAPADAAGAAAPPLTNGTEVYEHVCKTCHGPGLAGAPKAGDVAAWQPRIAKGKAILYQHSVEGFTGSAGVMPAKGARPDLSDDLVHQAVDHMIELAR
jgi:cytochrome c5